MILALRDDTSRHDAGRSLYGRSKARLPTGPASWPTRWGTCPTMVLKARSGRWLLPTSWPAWPAYSDQAPPEGTGWTPHRAPEQVRDPALENRIGGQADHIAVVLRFQELIDLRRGKTRIGSDVAPLHRGPVAGDHRLQHLTPTLGGVDVAGPQGTPLQVAELVEHEERMVAGAAEVAIVGAALLLAVGRADAGVHVEHDPLYGAASVHAVDPVPRQIRQHRKVGLLGQHLGFE